MECAAGKGGEGQILAIAPQFPKEERAYPRGKCKIRDCTTLNWMADGGKSSR